MNLYDLLAAPLSAHQDDLRAGNAPVEGRRPRPSQPQTTVTATIETTDERMINLRYTIAAP